MLKINEKYLALWVSNVFYLVEKIQNNIINKNNFGDNLKKKKSLKLLPSKFQVSIWHLKIVKMQKLKSNQNSCKESNLQTF